MNKKQVPRWARDDKPKAGPSLRSRPRDACAHGVLIGDIEDGEVGGQA
jgi:hypothetical protein